MSAYILAVVLYTGAACVSPLESAPNTTVAAKTPCAEIVRYSSANPYKIVQEQNVVSASEPRASSAKALPKYSYAKTKKTKKKKRRGRR